MMYSIYWITLILGTVERRFSPVKIQIKVYLVDLPAPKETEDVKSLPEGNHPFIIYELVTTKKCNTSKQQQH